MKIAYLGWGSLIWDQRELLTRGMWQKDGPALPVEYARISNDGGLTLVLYSSAKQVDVLWIHADTEDLAEAIGNLRSREGCRREKIEYVSLMDNSCNCVAIPSLYKIVQKWAKEKDLDVVLWTGLSSNFKDKTKTLLNEKSAVAYLKGLNEAELSKAEEYILNTPSQIQTNYRKAVTEALLDAEESV